MNVTSQRFADALLVKVGGRLDYDTSEAFGEQIAQLLKGLEGEGEAMVLDLSALDYVSSSGLNALIVASREAKNRRRRLYFAAPQPMVLEMFEISHLNLLVQVVPTVREAIAMISSRAATAFDVQLPRLST